MLNEFLNPEVFNSIFVNLFENVAPKLIWLGCLHTIFGVINSWVVEKEREAITKNIVMKTILGFLFISCLQILLGVDLKLSIFFAFILSRSFHF